MMMVMKAVMKMIVMMMMIVMITDDEEGDNEVGSGRCLSKWEEMSGGKSLKGE